MAKPGVPYCEHTQKEYSDVVVDSSPPRYGWRCLDCGVSGSTIEGVHSVVSVRDSLIGELRDAVQTLESRMTPDLQLGAVRSLASLIVELKRKIRSLVNSSGIGPDEESHCRLLLFLAEGLGVQDG
jgi:hypothetical protein